MQNSTPEEESKGKQSHFFGGSAKLILQRIINWQISKIKKIIWGILAAILIAICLFLLLPSLWFWISWEIVAAGLVAIGCFGEWHLFRTPASPGHEEEHRRRELNFILMVSIGVTMEFLALGHAIPEAIRLELDVEQSKKETEVLKSNSPEKKPVFAAAAFLTFSTTATNVIKAESGASTPMGKPVAGWLSLTRRSESLDNIATISLSAETFSQFGNEITMDLYWYPFFRRIVGTNRNETCEELINELNRGHFSAMLFKDTLSVSSASLTLVLNGTVRKEFKLGRYNRPPDGFPGVEFSLIEVSNATAPKQANPQRQSR